MKLYCFNPSHDEALANGSPTYQPGKAASGLATDLAALPLWYAVGGCVRLHPSAAVRRWCDRYAPLFAGTALFTPSPDALARLTAVAPWGWDAALCTRLTADGIPPHLLPSAGALATLRALASRRLAVDVLAAVRREADAHGWGHALCGRSYWCADTDAVRRRVEALPQSVLKAPWSGSGRGLRRAAGHVDDALEGWVRRVLHQQGGVVVEPWYDAAGDFALEFETDGRGGVVCTGLSAFATENGAYKGSLVAPQPRLASLLFPSPSAQAVLASLRSALTRRLAARVAPHYAGPLGVDLLLCRTAEGVRIHPCVEINLRHTMGHVALSLERLLPPGGEGRFAIDFAPDARQLTARAEARAGQAGWYGDGAAGDGGVLPLTPLTGQAHFHAFLEVTPQGSAPFSASWRKKEGNGGTHVADNP